MDGSSNHSVVSMAYAVTKIASNPVGHIHAAALLQPQLVGDIAFSFVVLRFYNSALNYYKNDAFVQI